uniref:Glycosyltransferase 2-like domain-containing protein n=1 Tax=viral metagenome TaxID=1070528 RepID=A0A6C0KWN6_9ZZZZ
MVVEINKVQYNVCNDEFEKIPHTEYNNLIILKDVGLYERIISLIKNIGENVGINDCVFYNVTHGGFIPLNCSENFANIYIKKCTEEHNLNILKNLKNRNYENIHFIEESAENVLPEDIIIFSENYDDIINLESPGLIVAPYNKDISSKFKRENVYFLSNTEFCIYVPERFEDIWKRSFQYYIDAPDDSGKQNFTYDNLINLCIMVKNAGAQFENMLTANLHLIDRWTILDTGSEDETIETIKKVLSDKKGELFQEPFINFRDSRNRLLELAGKTCKYTLMLDDTYIVNGDLRGFLNDVRGDQWGDSFTLYIKSDDVEYGSNRILRTDRDLKYLYRIHEVIQDKNNVNVVVPIIKSHIFDGRFEYMEERTMERKKLDLKLLFEELEEDPNNSRTHYYLAQTYNLLKEHDKAFHYFVERANHPNEGFIQEKIDAVFEAARIANFQLKKPWDECKKLYEWAYELDKSRPDSIYFLGIHHYMEGDRATAYEYFKLGFEIGYPLHCQYSLKPTLSYHFLPKFLTQLCYEYSNYEVGEKCARLFLENNLPNADSYPVIESWYKLFVNINKFLNGANTDPESKKIPTFEDNKKPILCFVADGGFNKWSGSTILTKGVGGSETYIIEMARHIQRQGHFQVMVFCNCEEEEEFEGVHYINLSLYFDFIRVKYVHTCIISRFSEYYPATILSNVDNIYMVAHDLTLTGLVIPIHNKLRKIFCLTEWHVSYFTEQFPILKDYLVPFYYGINPLFLDSIESTENIMQIEDSIKMEITEKAPEKIKNKFIYSSFPNRGLLQLLQMWPQILEAHPDATLDIYADVNGEWVNRVEPEMMKEVRELLFNSKYSNIKYHGWVNKSVLADAWKTAEYWFYPCIFMETFCLTALEAALTKTIVIANDLAALQNTVGDRGLVIPGNAKEKEWQEKAISELLKLMADNPESEERRERFIKRNYEWASKLTWESQANKLLKDHLLTNKIQYVGMQNWTHDLPLGQNAKMNFENAIEHFNLNNKNPNPRVLEVGTYAGTSLIAIVSRIPNSTGIGVDRWEDYLEFNAELLNNMISNNVEDSFKNNINVSGLEERIRGIKGDSFKVLLEFIKKGEQFDLIYVDGSHRCLDVCLDLFLSWQLLKSGGILAIDDYMYHYDKVMEQPYDYPFEAVNDFLKKTEKEYTILSKNYRVFLEKK